LAIEICAAPPGGNLSAGRGPFGFAWLCVVIGPLCTPIGTWGILPACSDPSVPGKRDAGCLIGWPTPDFPFTAMGDRLPPGRAAPISIANGPVPLLQYANPWMGGHQPLHTAVSGKSGAGQPIRHPASHLPGSGGRQFISR
jgi:hypothetical protein